MVYELRIMIIVSDNVSEKSKNEFLLTVFCGNEELKKKPVDYIELFKCKEDDPTEHMDTSAAPMRQCSGHLKTTKIVQYFCKQCDFRTNLECFIKKHLKIHKGVDDTYTKECNFKTPQSFSLAPHVKTSRSDEYICNECNFTTLNKNSLGKHMIIIHTGDEYKCKECDYKTVRKDQLTAHIKIHTGNEYKCKECDFKTGTNN
ncbi:hypothetical protein FQA39_LY10856 [Lamprigera yunnana]|nr:hypothetical protein FQA39_LY10856 [Lamprigera yunnana]